MPDIYDDGEAFAAGDDERTQFENDRLIAIIAVIGVLTPDPDLKTRLRRAILREIFGEVIER
jgi:hypothetical protein